MAPLLWSYLIHKVFAKLVQTSNNQYKVFFQMSISVWSSVQGLFEPIA